jgi:hypothetical protein
MYYFLSFFIFLSNLWAVSPGPIFSYKELSEIVGYHDVWNAYQSNRLSYDQVMALSSYVSYDDPIYPEINDYLRTRRAGELYYFSDIKELKKTIEHIDAGIKKLDSLPSNLLSFRGVSFQFRNNKCYDKNEVFIDRAFGSTSVKHSVAESFSGSLSDEIKSSGVLYLYSNDRHPGILINPLEDEVLLPRNLTFKVMDRVDQGKVCRLLVQICIKECTNEVSRPEVVQVWKSFFQK